VKEGMYYLRGPIPATTVPTDDAPLGSRETRYVGQALPRVDAYERVTGTAVYPSDVTLPGMLHAAILRCPHPSARVKSIDTSKAERMPGVRAVIHASTPGADIAWHEEEDGPGSRLFDPRCRFEGDAVAAVAAETSYQAWDAVRAIAVTWEELPFVLDAEAALEAGSPRVHEGDAGNDATEPATYARGDVERGFAEADAVVEQTFRTACELHTPLERHGCVARWDGPRLTVWESR